MDEITLDDKTYVSSKRAASITGYAKDYVGQLCREGRIEARLVGRNWYILESSIREHRFGSEVKKEPVKTEDGAYEPANYASENVSVLPTIDPSARTSIESPVDTADYQAGASLDHSQTVQEMQNAWQDWFTKKNIELPTQLEEELLETPEIIDEREASAVQTAPLASISEQNFIQETSDEPDEAVHVVRVMPEPPPHVFQQPEYKAPKSFNDIYQTEPAEIAPAYRPVTPSITPTYKPAEYQPRYTSQEALYASPRAEGRIVRERRVKKKQKPSVALQALFLSIAGIAIAVAVIGTGKADSFFNQTKIHYGPINFLGGESVVNKSNK